MTASQILVVDGPFYAYSYTSMVDSSEFNNEIESRYRPRSLWVRVN